MGALDFYSKVMQLYTFCKPLALGFLFLHPLCGSTERLLSKERTAYHTLNGDREEESVTVSIPSDVHKEEREKHALVAMMLCKKAECGVLPSELATLIANYATDNNEEEAEGGRLYRFLTEERHCPRSLCFCYFVCLVGGLIFTLIYLCWHLSPEGAQCTSSKGE